MHNAQIYVEYIELNISLFSTASLAHKLSIAANGKWKSLSVPLTKRFFPQMLNVELPSRTMLSHQHNNYQLSSFATEAGGATLNSATSSRNFDQQSK